MKMCQESYEKTCREHLACFNGVGTYDNRMQELFQHSRVKNVVQCTQKWQKSKNKTFFEKQLSKNVSECIVAYLGLLISVLTDLTGQNVSVNMPNDVSFAARASSSRVSVFTFVEGQAFLICYLGASSASIGHPRTPTHITSGNVARTGGKQLRRLLKNSRIQSKCIEHLSLFNDTI